MNDNGATIEDLKVAVNSAEPYPRNPAINILNGYTEPSLEALKAISKVCNCSTDYLLGLSDNPNAIG